MRIDDTEYVRILKTIDRLNAIDELGAFRAELRFRHAGDTRLDRIEAIVDQRMHDILDAYQDGRR